MLSERVHGRAITTLPDSGYGNVGSYRRRDKGYPDTCPAMETCVTGHENLKTVLPDSVYGNVRDRTKFEKMLNEPVPFG